MQQQENKLHQQRQDAERERGDLNRRQQELQQREEELQRRFQEAENRFRELEERERMVQQQQHEFENEQNEIQHSREQLDRECEEFRHNNKMRERERKDNNDRVLGPVGGIVLILLILLWLWAVQDCLRRGKDDFPSGEPNDKMIWTAVLLLTLFIGAILYVFLVQGHKKKQNKA